MGTRTHIVVALTLTALGLAPGAAHLMELPVKLDYTPQLYAEVTRTLYGWYGIAGGAVQVAAVVVVATLAIRLRRTTSFGFAMAAAAALGISLALWGALVAPVNASWAELSNADAEALAAAYKRLRLRWEYGHVAAFVAWLAGWMGMAITATQRTVVAASRHAAA